MISADPRALFFFSELKETLRAAGKLPQPPLETPTFNWFQAAALRRLDKGAEEYGHDSYLTRDTNLADEAIEEALDLVLYALLELAKTNPESCDGVPLGQAVYFAYLSYESLLDYKNKLRGQP